MTSLRPLTNCEAPTTAAMPLLRGLFKRCEDQGGSTPNSISLYVLCQQFRILFCPVGQHDVDGFDETVGSQVRT